MKEISSRSNPYVQEIVELHDPKGRAKQQKCVAQGVRTCKTLIDSGMILETLFCTELTQNAALLITSSDKIIKVPNHIMEKMSPVTQPSGILGVFEIPPQPDASQLTRGLVLTQISDPGNMGTLIRTAVALDTPSIVIVEGTDPWSPKVIHASAGTIARARIFTWSWQELILHKKSFSLCALIVSGGKKPEEISDSNFLLVVGNEAHGIPSEWVRDCSQTLTLDMPGKVESLNAAIAGSIALYALTRNTH